MMRRLRLYLFAIASAALFVAADALIVRTDRDALPWGTLAVASVMSAACPWLYWLMWRSYGAIGAKMTLDLVIEIGQIAVVLMAREKCSPMQWACFAVVVIAVLVSEVWG